MIGIVGRGVILVWAASLIRSSGGVLLDNVPDATLFARLRGRLEINGDRVTDLHLWRVGPGHIALIVSILTDPTRTVRRLHRFLLPLGRHI